MQTGAYESHDSAGGLARAIRLGEAARYEWIRDGVVISTDEFARRQGLTTDALAAAFAAGDTFCIAVNEQVRWPAVLLELEPQDAAEVCRALAGCDGVQKLLFLVRSHGALAGHTVSEALATGKRHAVLRRAREWACFEGSAA